MTIYVYMYTVLLEEGNIVIHTTVHVNETWPFIDTFIDTLHVVHGSTQTITGTHKHTNAYSDTSKPSIIIQTQSDKTL